ncbi:hypothetical protein P9112_003779 [Eukaryota sp. TZLM1-RC]
MCDSTSSALVTTIPQVYGTLLSDSAWTLNMRFRSFIWPDNLPIVDTLSDTDWTAQSTERDLDKPTSSTTNRSHSPHLSLHAGKSFEKNLNENFSKPCRKFFLVNSIFIQQQI